MYNMIPYISLWLTFPLHYDEHFHCIVTNIALWWTFPNVAMWRPCPNVTLCRTFLIVAMWRMFLIVTMWQTFPNVAKVRDDSTLCQVFPNIALWWTSLRRIVMNISHCCNVTTISLCRIVTNVSHRHNVTSICLLLSMSLGKV